MYTDEEKFKIWKSKSVDFNKWRSENDILRMLLYIQMHSESFTDWLKENDLLVNEIAFIVPSRRIFIGNEGTGTFELNGKSYESYFSWKEMKKDDRPFVINNHGKEFYRFDTNNNTISSPSNRKYSVGGEIDIETHSSLFGDIPVLKIGDTKLASDFDIFSRNLDFLDMSNIEIYDHTMPYTGLDLYFTLISNFKIRNCNIQNAKFNKCFCSNLVIENALVNNFTITNSSMDNWVNGITIEKSKLDRFSLIENQLENIWMSDTQVKAFSYIPEVRKSRNKKYERIIYENIKTLRLAFESSGNDSLTSKYYYLEKKYKRKSFKSFVEDIGIKRHYGGPYRRIIYNLMKRNYTFKNSLMYIGWLNKYYWKLITNKDYHQLVKEQILSYISWITWGYGEKPFRIIFNSILLMMMFAGIYYFSNNESLTGNLVNSLYYSAITFTTLGYGDIVPSTGLMKLTSAIEAVLGAFSLGLVIAGYTIKARN